MKETMTLSSFIRGFEEIRPDNFSYEGLEMLFSHLESMESDEHEIEYDVIAFCCDYSEMSFSDIMSEYEIQVPVTILLSEDEMTCDYKKTDLSDEEIAEYITEYIDNKSFCVGVTSENTVVFQCF